MSLKRNLLNALVAEIARLDEDSSSSVSEELNAGAIRRVVTLFFKGYENLPCHDQLAIVQELTKITRDQIVEGSSDSY